MQISLRWRHNECDSLSNHRVSIVCSTVGSGVDQRKFQSSALLAFVCGIRWWPVNFLHNMQVERKIFAFDNVIMSPEELGQFYGDEGIALLWSVIPIDDIVCEQLLK